MFFPLRPAHVPCRPARALGRTDIGRFAIHPIIPAFIASPALQGSSGGQQPLLFVVSTRPVVQRKVGKVGHGVLQRDPGQSGNALLKRLKIFHMTRARSYAVCSSSWAEQKRASLMAVVVTSCS